MVFKISQNKKQALSVAVNFPINNAIFRLISTLCRNVPNLEF